MRSESGGTRWVPPKTAWMGRSGKRRSLRGENVADAVVGASGEYHQPCWGIYHTDLLLREGIQDKAAIRPLHDRGGCTASSGPGTGKFPQEIHMRSDAAYSHLPDSGSRSAPAGRTRMPPWAGLPTPASGNRSPAGAGRTGGPTTSG